MKISDKESGTIDNLTLGCGYDLQLVSREGTRSVFREKIKPGALCASGGSVSVELVDAQTVKLQFFRSGGTKWADATLKKQ